MRPLIDREKRIIRIAVVGVVVYLALFYGYRIFGKKYAEYHALVVEAQDLRRQIQPYQDRVLVAKKLMEEFHIDPAKLKKETVVADASAAIQKAAKAGGLQLGPIRESPAHGSGKALATVQLESSGQIPAMLTFLAGLNSIGFPVVVDSVQFTADTRPGQIKMNLTLIILDFDQIKSAEVPHA